MAEQQDIVQSGNTFTAGLYKDVIDLLRQGDIWSHARNATTMLPDGQYGGIHTEPANIKCCTFPYPLIGAIPLAEDQWMVFLTDDTTSEIGLFRDDQCSYETITGPQTCIGFNREHLIIGASRRGYDCGFDVYWSDGGYNVDRFINTAKVPFVQIDITPTGPCRTYVDTTVLDCEKLRLTPHMAIPCMTLAKSEGSGQLDNGTYQVYIRYSINGIPCTDFIAQSPIMSIWAHNNSAGALRLTITGAETHIFNEMEVVIVSEINRQIQARVLGIYSTFQTTIYIDDLDRTLLTVPLAELPINNPQIEKSDAIYAVGSYLTRVGTRTKPEPNYQLLANNIRAHWACVEYNDQYYHRGGDSQGMNVAYMRDEVYAYYIRWIWNTGQKTLSYHIPGLPAGTAPTVFLGSGGLSTGDTGTVVAYGRMRGYSSTELYPDAQPAVWGPLCGLPIMHHMFPNQSDSPVLTHFTNQNTIRIMGVWFDNIALPVDNNGTVLPDIVGYEILRASREGHKSVIAKGQVNHMRGYQKANGTFGLYQNYPYNDLHADRYLTTSQTIGTVGGTVDGWQGNQQTYISPDVVSFHSPDTTFQHPNLGGSGSLTLYQAHAGIASGTFDIPYLHPQMRLLTDLSSTFASQIALMVGFMNIISSTMGTGAALSSTNEIPLNIPIGFNSVPDLSILGTNAAGAVLYGIAAGFAATIQTFLLPITEKVVSQQILNVVNGMVPTIQYARQYNSHGFYDQPVYSPSITHSVTDYQYVSGYLQTFGDQDINNLYRNDYLALRVEGGIPTTFPIYTNDPVTGAGQNYQGAIRFLNTSGPGTGTIVPNSVDCSRFTLGQAPSSPYPPGFRAQLGPFESPIVSWYGAYKVPQPSQYGQIDSGVEIPISCVQAVDTTSTVLYTTPILFGGDTYINRYTEKNPFFFFNDWLVGQQNDYLYDYTQYENVPYPRYWINNSKVYFDQWVFGPGSGASKNWHLDELASTANNPWPPLPFINSKFYVESGYFYLFNNGIRDFYVESEINVGYRDWEDDHSKRFYDPYAYTTLEYMFRSDIIKSDIFYKYDYSLSASKFFNQYISWGKMFDRSYDPNLAYTCFSYYPRRINYSLPQDEEDKRDNWRIFLGLNYRDMPGQVTAIKDISDTGALILMKDRPPAQFIGVQTIPSTNGTDYTTGNGLLFEQALTAVSNADQALQYGSCQNRQSVVNTPYGVFWVSRDTGKVFSYNGQSIQDITPGLKWHLSRYLPSELLTQFPDYALPDSPLMGIGIQCVYDNVNEVLYICKKDYKAIDPSRTVYVGPTTPGTGFYYNTGVFSFIPVQLNDPQYFENCSWSLSYDCRKKQWISYHSWIPALSMGSKRHFLTSNSVADNGRSVWRHNNTTALWCNYYGVPDYFEIGYYAGTSTQETTLSNLEVISESYQYRANSTDRFQIYDHWFNYAMISNPEQNSYTISLALQPYDDPYATLNYPQITPTAYSTVYSKVENKYRMNMFVDLTNDRYQNGTGTIQAIQTAGNGFSWSLVNAYFDLAKPWNEQKKFRYRGTQVLLRRTNVGTGCISVLGAKSNNQVSRR